MLSLYIRLIGARIRSQMQYRFSFWAELVAFILITAMDFAVILILTARFQQVGGWSVAELALLYGLTSFGFSLAEMIGRGFDSPFERMIQMGAFDGVLTRPLGAFFQILASDFQLRRLGRTIQASLALAYAFSQLAIVWSPDRLLLIPITIAASTFTFIGLTVIGASITIWTVKTPEVVNAFTYGGLQLTSYPLSIYQEWLRNLFLFIIPVGFANYPAALYLLGRSDPHGLPTWAAWCAPLAAGAFFALALRIWAYGVSKYTSTGS